MKTCGTMRARIDYFKGGKKLELGFGIHKNVESRQRERRECAVECLFGERSLSLSWILFIVIGFWLVSKSK